MAEERFLARWSRLKTEEARRPAPPSAPSAETPPEASAAEAAEGAPAAAEPAPFDPATLPPVESLTSESDFKPFLQSAVPEELRQAALRQLWRSDPVWAGPEVLDLHNLDYTLPAVPEVVRTAYRVGKGFLDAVEEAEEKLAAAERALEPAPNTDG